MTIHRLVPSLAAALALVVTGCGSDDSSSSREPPASQATSTTGASPETEAGGAATNVSMTEMKFEPSSLSAKAGKLPLTAKNNGTVPHELVLIRTDRAPDALPMKGLQASEAGAVGEIPEQAPGQSATKTFQVQRGTYVYVCNVPGHYKSGMVGRLTIR